MLYAFLLSLSMLWHWILTKAPFQWVDLMGKCDQKTVESILDFYYEKGGNFIDTYVL